jgi:hypothetical protein
MLVLGALLIVLSVGACCYAVDAYLNDELF